MVSEAVSADQSATMPYSVARHPLAVAAPLSPGSRRVLAVVEDEVGGRTIVDWLVRSLPAELTPDVVLLSVQPRPDDVRVRGYLRTIREHLLEVGRRRLSEAVDALQAAAVPHTIRVELSDDAHVILRYAGDESCGLIVMATRPIGAISRGLLRATGIGPRSTAGRVAELADIPVVILRREPH